MSVNERRNHMKTSTKLTLMIWGIGILAELIYAFLLFVVAKAFDITISKMFYYISSSFILSVCLYFDKFHNWNIKDDNKDNS